MRARDVITFFRELSRGREAARAAEVAGDTSAGLAGRTTWNLDDYRVAAAVFDAICPPLTPEDLMARATRDHEATVSMGGVP